MRAPFRIVASPAAAGLMILCSALLLGAQYFRPLGATIVVTNTNDTGPGSLRQALPEANDGDVIGFDPALNGQTITLTSAELVIDKNITITGPGPGLLTVSRNQQAPNFRILHILPNHTVAISGLTIRNGQLQNENPGAGAGIYNDGTLSVVNTTVTGNSTTGQGSGGGGISNQGSLTIIQSTISGNSDDDEGGGILNSGMLTIIESSVSDNHCMGLGHYGGDGGGVYNSGTVTIQNTTISGNMALGADSTRGGGGIFNSGSLTVINSTIRGNTAINGGGIFGGATIVNSTVSSNTAWIFGNAIQGSGTISNSTISGNTASQGGGIGVLGGFIITNSTISDNGGYNIFTVTSVALGHTVLKASPSGVNIGINGGSVTSHGYNLSSDNGGGFLTGPGDQINTELLLGPLQDNGGPTFTHLLLKGSPAINMGDPNFTPPPSTDQRGYPRVFDGRIDIGSVEVQPTPTPTATATVTATPTATATAPTPGPVTHFTIEAPPDVIQFVPFTFSVTARDQFGKVGIDYTGTVHFTSTDTGKGTQLPNDSTLIHGTGTFTAILTTPDYQTITATDTVTSSITGTSSQILVFENQPSPTPTPTPCTGTVVWSQNFDQLPTGTPRECFYVSNVDPDTPPNDLYQPDPDGVVICGYQFGNNITIPNASSVFRFRNKLNTEFSDGKYRDGGVLEVSSPNISGGEFLDITDSHVGATVVSGGYTGMIVGGPLDGRFAWVGDSGGYIDTVINLGPNLAGQTVTFLFRFVSDEAVAAPGWRIDTITIADGICPTPTPSPTPTPTPVPSPARPLNLSTRMLVQTGDNVGIGGFIIIGSTPKQILLRGIGPSLIQFGIPNALADPIMELHGPAGFTTITNDNWRDMDEGGRIQATGLAPTNDLESAILVTLNPGTYTGIVKGKNDTIGVGLVEIFDLGPLTSQMFNISTRAFVGTGGDVVIGGFILDGGNFGADMILYGRGPSLGSFGVPNPLADPILELRDNNGALLGENDDCSTPFGSTSLESCLQMVLPPGLYTAILAGKDGGTGVGLVEIYDLE